MTRTSKKTITIVAALLSLLLLISPFSPMILYASAATNEMEISISPVDSKGSTVGATSGVVGDKITITLPLVCNGQNISNIIVSPIVSENLDEFPFVIEKLDYTLKKTGTITKGTVCDFQYNFKISSQATAGVKKVGFDVTYTDASNQTQSTVVYLYVTVEESPTVALPEYTISPKVIVQRFDLNKSDIKAGEAFSINLTLLNTSVEQNIYNAVLKISDEASVFSTALGTSGTIYLGKIEKSSDLVATMQLLASSSASSKVYPIGVTIEYEGEDGESYTSTDTIFISVIGATVSSEPTYSTTPKVVVQKFESNKASLTAGTEFELDLTLFNTSVEQNISNLVIKVSDENGNIVPVNGSSTSMYVGSITKNVTSVVTVPMMVATSATTQNCAITVTLEYEGEDGESHTSTDTIFVSVIGAAAPSEPTYSTTPKVVVQKFESSKASLTAGTEFELDLTLFNTSVEQNISNLVIKVSDENGNVIPANGSSTSMYVGSITKNATSIVTVPMMVATSATTQNCAITVTLEYEGEDGESYTSTDTIFVSVIGAAAPSEPTYSTTPKAIIKSVTIKKVVSEEESATEDNSIYAGDVIELTLVIFNTSEEQTVHNVLLKFNEESNSIIPIDGVVDSSYVGAISKGKNSVVSVKMCVLDSSEAKTYPLNITMEYEGDDTQSYSVSQSAFITVKESANSQATPTYSTTPKVIVKSTSVNNESIVAGDSFEITLTLRNTSAEQDIHNLVVKLTDESGVVIPVKGSSSSVYAGAISKESEQAIKLVMQTPSTAETKGYSLSVILEYEGDDKQSYTVNDSVVVQINQLPKLTIENPVLYDTPWLNQTCGTSLSIFNTGRSDIYNCLITIEGEGLTLETSYFGGIIKAGSSLESNFNIIPTKDGEVSGNIVVSYEDAMGNKYEQKCPIELFVNKDYTSTDTPSDVTVDKGGEQNNSWIIVVVIVVVILLCGVLVFVIIKNNRKRRLSDL